ncbi:linoleate 13S-lipoxygenase 3-1, chloroplastic, partial [Tanacetum coccineum]
MLHSTKYMAVVDTLSTHSPDEEYIGERQQQDTWSGDAEMVEAFYGVLPYELLAPSSEPGVMCRGIPCIDLSRVRGSVHYGPV